MDDLDRLIERNLEDSTFRTAYEAKKPAIDLATRLFELRSALGLTQREVAARAGITQPEIARLESGEIGPTWETVSRVLGALGARLELKVTAPDGKLIRLELPASAAPSRIRRKAKAS